MKSCSTEHRTYAAEGDLESCKNIGASNGATFIYWQPGELRPAGTDYCHTYSLCDEYRTVSAAGTHYEYICATQEPTSEPTRDPTYEPTREPTKEPTREPTKEPTQEPTVDPTRNPTNEPTRDPTQEPTQGNFLFK